MSTPLVSILIPMKNTAVFLPECLDSILAQTYTNWELLIVDDHSDDASYDIVNTYTQQDSRMTLLTNKGNGIISALQTAYAASTGEYLTRMDSDDVMLNNKIESLTHTLQNKGLGFLSVGLVHYFSSLPLGQGYQNYADWLNDLTLKASNFKDIYKECSIPSPCWMTHRHDFDRSGGFTPHIYPEDYDLAFRFRKIGLQIAPVKEIIHHWRDYPSRTSRTDEHYADNQFAALKIHHFLDQDYDSKMDLILWGAGHKGKKLASLLLEKNIPFQWFCNNHKKIGKEIYGILMEDVSKLSQLKKQAQVILAVSAQHDTSTIDAVLTEQIQHQYFRFC